MLKHFRRQLISLVLVFAMVASMFSVAVYATKQTFDYEEIELSFTAGEITMSGNAEDGDENADIYSELTKMSNTRVKITANSYKNCSDYSSGKAKVLVEKPAHTQMDFDFALSGGGTVEVRAETEVGDLISPVGSKYTVGIETFWILLTTDKSQGARSELTLSNISLKAIVNCDVTVQGAPNGTVSFERDSTDYTLSDGQSQVVNMTSVETLQLAAEPAEGYTFAGYYIDNGEYAVSANPNFSYTPTGNVTIKPMFISKGTPAFMVGGEATGYGLCYSFDDAITAATYYGLQYIIPLAAFEIDQDYTVPSGTTLLIPNDDEHTVYTTKPNVLRATAKQSAYMKVRIKSGAELTFANGAALSIAGNYYAPNGGGTSSITGAYGQLIVEEGAQATFLSGSSLYAWGFATGGGVIECQNGVNVYESFQINDFCGGTLTSKIFSTVFPFSQYYVQNVECKLKVYAGAQEIVYGALYASSAVYDCSLVFIGGEGSLFHVSDGYVLKYYDFEQDKLICEIYGDASIDTITVTLPMVGATNIASYQMPISNIGVDVKEGTVTIYQDLQLLPDSYVTVDNGATVDIQSNVYIIDDDDWEGQNRVYNKVNLRPLVYSATRYDETGNGASPRSGTGDMDSAVVDVNGTLTISGSGTVNTTAGGAEFYSSEGTGTVINTSSVSGGSKSVALVDFSIADDDSKAYTESVDTECVDAKNTAYSYDAELDRWYTSPVTVTFKTYGNTTIYNFENVAYKTPLTGVTAPARPYNDDQYAYVFTGWKRDVDKKIYQMDDPLVQYALENSVFTAQFQLVENNFTVTWVDEDGTVLETDENLTFGTTPEFNGTDPEKASDENYDYIFSGWTPEVVTVRGDATYTATYTAVPKGYTIRWLNEDGTVLETDKGVQDGEIPTYDGATPTKEPSNGVTYTFDSWDPEVTAADGDADYTATFKGNYFRSHSLSLNGRINANFYWNLPEGADISDYQVVFTCDGQESDPVAISDSDYGYRASYPVDAPEMTFDITASLMYNNGKIDENTFKAAEYAQAISGYPSFESELEIDTPYLIGKLNGAVDWSKASPRYKMVVNTEAENGTEYMLQNIPLTAGDEFKVVIYKGENTYWWYPNGDNNNYTVAANGVYNVYFREQDYAADGWWYNHIRVETVSAATADYQNAVLPLLLQATLNYGSKAQTQFGVKTDDLADSDTYLAHKGVFAAVTKDMITAKLGSEPAKVSKNVFDAYGLEYLGASLVMNSNTKLKLYFGVKSAETFDQYKDTFSFGGKSVTAQRASSDVVYFEVSDIEAANLDARYTLYNTADDSVSVQYSALDYVSLCLDDGDALSDLCHALYWYNVYADAYFV